VWSERFPERPSLPKVWSYKEEGRATHTHRWTLLDLWNGSRFVGASLPSILIRALSLSLLQIHRSETPDRQYVHFIHGHSRAASDLHLTPFSAFQSTRRSKTMPLVTFSTARSLDSILC
jgi:hypothetical protein